MNSIVELTADLRNMLEGDKCPQCGENMSHASQHGRHVTRLASQGGCYIAKKPPTSKPAHEGSATPQTTDLELPASVEDLNSMLDERGKHWPFKNKSTLGATSAHKYGPPPHGTRSVSQTDDWICKRKGKLVQICKSGDRKKIVRINPTYRKKYNRAYRAYRAAQGGKKKAAAKAAKK